MDTLNASDIYIIPWKQAIITLLTRQHSTSPIGMSTQNDQASIIGSCES
jgi:hypothetical protein